MATTLSQNLLLAVPLAPLAGCIVAGFFGKAVGRRGAHGCRTWRVVGGASVVPLR